MRKVVGISTSRADYGIYRSVFRAINEDPELSLELIVSGTHLSESARMTLDEIELDEGDSLIIDTQDNWTNSNALTDTFQNYNELTSSLSQEMLNSLRF